MGMRLRKILRTLAKLMNIPPCAPTSTTTASPPDKIRPAKALVVLAGKILLSRKELAEVLPFEDRAKRIEEDV